MKDQARPNLLCFLARVVIEALIDLGVDSGVVLLDNHIERLAALRDDSNVRVFQTLRNTAKHFATLRLCLLNLLSTAARRIECLFLEGEA